MIKFTATSDRGMMLGLGFSYGNLELLERGLPIEFPLEPLGGRGTAVILAGGEAEMRAAYAGPYAGRRVGLIALSVRTLDTLRRGEVVDASIAELPDIEGFGPLVMLAAPTEYELIDLLRQAGLVPEGAPIEGMEEYRQHERGEVEGCPFCEAGSHGLELIGQVPSSVPSSGRTPKALLKKRRRKKEKGGPARRGPEEKRSGWRAWLADHWIVVVAPLVILAAIGIREGMRRREAAAAAEARARVLAERGASHHARLDAIQRSGGLPPDLRLSERPCPAEIRGPRPLRGEIFLRHTFTDYEGSPYTHLEAVFRDAVLEAGELDVFPGRALGGAPLTQRVHFDHGSERPFRDPPPPHHLDFVVESWADPEVPPGLEVELRRRVRATAAQLPVALERPGQVRGRLWVWSYAERRYVCGSPSVEASTSAMVITSQSRLGTIVADSPLAKAQAETLLAGVRQAVEALREVAR